MKRSEGVTPAISVIMPVRNGGPFLRQALASVLGQSFGDFELLLLDDGSTDGSAALACGLGDARIRVLGDSVPRGMVHRLNEGVAVARGRYIARMDADDVSFPQRFEQQAAFLDAHPQIDLLGCRTVAFRGDGDVIGLLPYAPDHEALCAQVWNNIPLPHPSWMGRREWFRGNPYRSPEVIRAEDQELLLRASKTSCYACLPEVLLGYRQGDFKLRRTLVARRSLLAAQLGLFARRRELLNLLRALGVTAVKTAVDIAACLPGMGRAWFVRMGSPAPPPVVAQLNASLSAGRGQGSTA